MQWTPYLNARSDCRNLSLEREHFQVSATEGQSKQSRIRPRQAMQLSIITPIPSLEEVIGAFQNIKISLAFSNHRLNRRVYVLFHTVQSSPVLPKEPLRNLICHHGPGKRLASFITSAGLSALNEAPVTTGESQATNHAISPPSERNRIGAGHQHPGEGER